MIIIDYFILLGVGKTQGVSNLVGSATERTENVEFFLRDLSVLCGEWIVSPSFWTLSKHTRIACYNDSMYSIRELYRIGHGPSSSHTMGPANAAILFRQRFPQAQAFRV